MNRRTFIILIVIIAVMSAILMMDRQGLDGEKASAVLPGLDSELNNITRLTIIAAGNRTVATLNRGTERWTVAEYNDYPADVGKIRGTLIALANATVIEEKTSDPALYSRLGVEDIADEDASGLELIIDGANTSKRIIVGKTGIRGDQAYVRLPDAAISLLITANLVLGAEPTDWLDHTILNIPASDIFRVTTIHPDGETIRIEKTAGRASGFELINLPADAEISYANAADSIGSVLAGLRLEDVMVRTNVDLEDFQTVITRFETFDGLIITASVYTN